MPKRCSERCRRQRRCGVAYGTCSSTKEKLNGATRSSASPDFRIGDPYSLRSSKSAIFLRTTPASRVPTSMGCQPRIAIRGSHTPDQYAKPAYSFRGGFQYHNACTLVAGKVIENERMPWERFVFERIFTPLGMSNTYPTLAAALKHSNRSRAHYE